MRIHLATLLCVLGCCALVFFDDKESARPANSAVSIREAHLDERASVVLSTPHTEQPRTATSSAPRPTQRSRNPKSGPRTRKSRGWLQVEVTPHAASSPHDRFGLSIRRGKRLKEFLTLQFDTPSFEVDLPVGEYTVIVSDCGYPWHWKDKYSRHAQPDSPNLFIHQETVRITADQNRLVFVDPVAGGRFMLHAAAVPFAGDEEYLQRLRKGARINSLHRAGECFYAPPKHADATLINLNTKKQVPLAWAYTDALNFTGSVELDRGQLMQNVLPAGEYELTLTRRESEPCTTRFQIEDGKTTAVVLPCELF